MGLKYEIVYWDHDDEGKCLFEQNNLVSFPPYQIDQLIIFYRYIDKNSAIKPVNLYDGLYEKDKFKRHEDFATFQIKDIRYMIHDKYYIGHHEVINRMEVSIQRYALKEKR